jgi:hypothetical protein
MKRTSFGSLRQLRGEKQWHLLAEEEETRVAKCQMSTRKASATLNCELRCIVERDLGCSSS